MAVKKAEKVAREENEDAAVIAVSEQEGIMADVKSVSTEKVKLMYVGPTLPDGKLKTNAVLIGTKDEIFASVKDAIKEYPEAERLFVDVGRAAEVKAKIRTPGNLYNKYHTTIRSLIEARKGGR